jgi:glutamyl-tRNA synthetase
VKNPACDAAEIAALLQARCEKLTDIPEKVDFFDALPDYDTAFYTNKKSKTDALLWPVRIAVSGRLVTPGGAVELCHILGREETLRRLRDGIGRLSR